jgi:hypothetical protein
MIFLSIEDAISANPNLNRNVDFFKFQEHVYVWYMEVYKPQKCVRGMYQYSMDSNHSDHLGWFILTNRNVSESAEFVRKDRDLNLYMDMNFNFYQCKFSFNFSLIKLHVCFL